MASAKLYNITVHGIPLAVTARYNKGAPATRLDPADPAGWEIESVVVIPPMTDILTLLDEALYTISDELDAQSTSEEDYEQGDQYEEYKLNTQIDKEFGDA